MLSVFSVEGLLLLILRTLIIFLIVLFISRPILKGEFSNWVYNPQSTITAIIVDDSFSMNGIRNNEESHELLESAILNIKKSLIPKQKVIFGSLSNGIEFFGAQEEFDNFKFQIDITDLNYGIGNILQQLNDTINHDIINQELYLLTDLQSNSFNINNGEYDFLNDWNTFIIDFNIPDENLVIQSMKIGSEIVLPNESFEVNVSVINPLEVKLTPFHK